MADSPKNRDANARIPDLRGLKEFAQKSDRQDPPAFAGRKDQIAGLAKDLRTRTKDSMAGKSDAWEGAAWLFQGAPGAGKTALLRHLQNLKIQAPAGNGYLKSKRHLAAAAVAGLDEFPQGATRSRMAGTVQEVSDRAGGAGAHNDLALPKGMDAADFVDGLMKSGVLHEDADGYLSVPIPSFRDVLIERYPAPGQGAAPETGNPPSPASLEIEGTNGTSRGRSEIPERILAI